MSTCTRIEITGNLIVHHPIPESVAMPGVIVNNVYYCSCNGCGFCKGREAECTCDIDWERLYHRDYS
jgi:hypothetical protein